MALLFQSNPDQWDLRKYLTPGDEESWFVNRYFTYMKPGVLILLWEAQGSQSPEVRGLYGWGITLGEPVPDRRGRLRIPLQYVERWVNAADVNGRVPESRHIAGVPAKVVLELPSWHNHPLNRMPAGTNFVVTAEQLRALHALVSREYPASAFGLAVEKDIQGLPLVPEEFEKRLVKQRVPR
jgi:hypothetical protein